MSDNPLHTETFNPHLNRIHQDGIKKFGKAYKQHSHRVLVSAFSQALDQLQVTSALEIGAFSAEFSQQFISQSTERTALAVEANPYNFKKFNDTVTGSGVLYHHAAVLDHNGPCELQLQVTEVDLQTGYIRGNNSILASDARPQTRAVTVPGTTLDTLVANYVDAQQFPDPAIHHPVLWIDVEGALDLVIQGGKETIANTRLILAEVEATQLWNHQAVLSDIVRLLDPLNFTPWLRDCEYEPDQFNVLFVNRKFVDITQFASLEAGFYRDLETFKP